MSTRYLAVNSSGAKTITVYCRYQDGTSAGLRRMDDVEYESTDSAVPEPASCALLGCAVGGAGATLQRHRKQ
jgi:hypothetical protein